MSCSKTSKQSNRRLLISSSENKPLHKKQLTAFKKEVP
ncbi:hypothetical protein LRHMDP2_2703 [Lacticaseibacillus rhamnosus LRHMDP2]|nr:hypothetical protein LRHMDP2_2703 [Lacticaseibacillus rhamnosus LRHMDP2]